MVDIEGEWYVIPSLYFIVLFHLILYLGSYHVLHLRRPNPYEYLGSPSQMHRLPFQFLWLILCGLVVNLILWFKSKSQSSLHC